MLVLVQAGGEAGEAAAPLLLEYLQGDWPAQRHTPFFRALVCAARTLKHRG